jgi:hypothetical protein
MNRRVSGLQSGSGYFGEEKNIFHVPGIEPRIDSRPAPRLVTVLSAIYSYKGISIQRHASVCTSYNESNEATISKKLNSDLCDCTTSAAQTVTNFICKTVNILYLLLIRSFFDTFYV